MHQSRNPNTDCAHNSEEFLNLASGVCALAHENLFMNRLL
jgi:hypothetical protein